MKAIIIRFYFSVCCCLQAQEVIWEQFYVQPYPRAFGFEVNKPNNEGRSLSIAKDGSLLWATRGSPYVTILYKLDKNGNELWKKVINHQKEVMGRVTDNFNFYERKDGLLASVGMIWYDFFRQFGYPYYKTLSQTGDEIWSGVDYTSNDPKIPSTRSYGLRLFHEGTETRVVTMNDDITNSKGDIEYYVLDTNSFEKKYRKFPSGKYENRPETIIRLQNGSILILASYITEDHEMGAMGCLNLKNDDSTIIFAKVYQDNVGGTFPRNVIQAKNGDLVFCGFTLDTSDNTYQPFLLRTDDTLGVKWQRVYRIGAGDYHDYIATKLAETEDGGFAVIGNLEYKFDSKLLMFRVDREGDLEWSKVWDGREQLDDEHLSDLIVNSDRSITVTGSYAFEDTALNITAYLAKIRDGVFKEINDQQDNEAKIAISPNPLQKDGIMELCLPAENEKIEAVILDINGVKVKTLFSGIVNGKQAIVKFQTNGLSNGVYFIKIATRTKVEIKKITLIN